jgi:chitinase
LRISSADFYTSRALNWLSAIKSCTTGNEPKSLRDKVAYMKKHKLGGIMFCELKEDATVNGLLDVMHSVIHEVQ